MSVPESLCQFFLFDSHTFLFLKCFPCLVDLNHNRQERGSDETGNLYAQCWQLHKVNQRAFLECGERPLLSDYLEN